jgi:hypothetical protein
MGKEDAVRLAGIYEPGNFPLLGDIFGYKEFFIFRLALLFLMTSGTLLQLRHTGKTAVITKKMTALASIINRLDMKGVVEIEWLAFLGI